MQKICSESLCVMSNVKVFAVQDGRTDRQTDNGQPDEHDRLQFMIHLLVIFRNQWVAQICRRKWGWIGHTLRKPASNITRQALTLDPQGKKKRGRPRNTWQRDTKAETLMSGHSWKKLEKTAQSWVSLLTVINGLCSLWGKSPK